MGYSNPIIPGFNPDPSVCRVGQDYYLVTSSFEYFPGVPIYHSRDLFHWEPIGYCLTRESQLPLHNCRSSGGIYAPTLRHRKGVFYMTTTNTTGGGNFYVTATDPAGPWSEPIWVKAAGIDPSFFFDEDGRTYYQSSQDKASGKPVSLCEIDLATGELTGGSRSIWPGTGGSWPEGPHLYKRDGWYYIMIAEGGTETGHMETIARSRSLWGPYDSCPRNPILSHRFRSSIIHGTGHADLVEAHDGSWWMVFLAFRHAGNGLHHLGRETFLAPVAWDTDGWPVVNGGQGITLDMAVQTLPPVPLGPARGPDFDGFDGPGLAFCWNTVRSPAEVRYSLAERPGCLSIWGNRHTLDAVASPAFVGRRQTELDCTAAVRMEIAGIADGEEAGLAVFYNDSASYAISVAGCAGRHVIRVRRKAGDMEMVSYEQPFDGIDVTLALLADRGRYFFGYGADLDAAVENLVASGSSRFLSSEVYPGTFTGVYLGMFATGNGHDCMTPVVFDDFVYEPSIHRSQAGKSIPYREDTPIGTLLDDPRAREILDRLLPGMAEKIDRSSPAMSSPLSPRIAYLVPELTGDLVRDAIEELKTL